jgi:hypothetical protein
MPILSKLICASVFETQNWYIGNTTCKDRVQSRNPLTIGRPLDLMQAIQRTGTEC